MAATLFTLIASTAVAATSAAIAGTSVIAASVFAAGSVTVSWAVRKWQSLNKPKGAGGGSGVATPAETQAISGIRTASHVIGRAKLTEQDYLLVYAGRHDLGNDRIALNLVYVLSEGPCEGVEEVYIDDFLAMRAPDTGANSPSGAIQYLEPALSGPDRYDNDTVKTWQEVYQSARDNGRTIDEAIDDLDNTDFLRFRAIQRVRRKNGGVRGLNPIYIGGANRPTDPDAVYIADWGTWCRAWVYPTDGFVENGAVKKDFLDQSKLSEDPDWKTDDYLGRGKCIVHLQLERSNFDAPFSTSIPKIDFVVKGRKITWPGQTVPTWTENAAAVRYWFQTELEGISPTAIDTTDFQDAYNKCEETVTFTTSNPDLANYTKTGKRYTINGLFLHDPSFYRQYKDDMDVAWQGEAVESRGKFHYLPGYARPHAFTIGPENTVNTPTFTPQPGINDRVNAVRTTMPQSLDDNFDAVDLPVIQDSAAIQRDGEYLERELQIPRFLKYPIAALNIMHIALNKARASGRLTKTLMLYPADFEGNTYPAIKVGQRVPVNDPELGLVNADYEVVSHQMNDDWTVSVDLRESPATAYDNLLDIPSILHPRRLSLPDSTTRPPPVSSLTAVGDVRVGDDGTLLLSIATRWAENSLATEVTITDADGNEVASGAALPYHEALRLSVPFEGTYTVSVVHVSDTGRQSFAREATATVDASGITPPAPDFIRADTGDDHFTFFFRPFPEGNLNVAGIEFRYRVKNIDSTDAFPALPTPAQFSALPTLTRGPVAPIFGPTGFTTVVQVPFGGRYRIYARSVTRDERVSDIVDLGQDFPIAGLRPSTGSVNFHPQWEGTSSNMGRLWSSAYSDNGIIHNTINLLVRDRPDASRVQLRDWNGERGWPFGVETGSPSTYTVNPAINFGGTGNYELRYEIELFDPAGGNHSYTITYQPRLNGVAVGNPVSAGAVNNWVRVSNVNEVQLTLNVTSAGSAVRFLTLYFRAVV